jgi:hypothetical protein
MSIRFACKCGKHLRAGDTMAGRHTLCPKCGALVAIPTLEQAASGAAVPRANPSPAEPSSAPAGESDEAEDIGPVLVRVRRRNDKDPNQFRKSIWVPLDPERGPPPDKLPKPVRTSPRRRYVWQLETYWFQCLKYPFRAWRLLAALGLAQAAFLVWTALFVPRFNGVGDSPAVSEGIVYCLAAFIAVVYTIGLFDCILASAGAGEYRVFRMPGIDLGIQGAASCLVCFLAGPVIPATIGLLYWRHCGDPDLVDRSILAELAGATFAYWLFEILAARETGGWWADPAAVFSIHYRTGPRSLLAAVGPPLLGYAYLRVVFGAMAFLYVNGLFAFPRLVAATTAGLFAVTFLLRVIGVWCYRGRPAEPDKDERLLAATEPAANSKSKE